MKNTLTKSQLNLVAALESLFPKKFNGGDLLGLGASFIPGAGPLIGPALGMLNQMFVNKPVEDTPPINFNNNPYGNIMEHGGVINNGFKQYSTGSHNSGKDLGVDVNGNASSNPVAFVQNKENTFMVGNTPFVMSDTLKNPETGNTFNKDAAKLNKSLPKASFNTEDKNTLKLGMERLAKLNNSLKEMKEGGKMTYEDGGPFVPRRIDPFTGRESNLISDAPAFDPMMEPLDFLPQISTPMVNRSSDKIAPFSPLPQADQYPSLLNRVTSPKPLTTAEPNTDVNSFVPEEAVSSNDPLQSYSGETAANTASSNSRGFDLNIPAIGLKAISLGKSLADSLEKPLVESPILPDYTVSDRYMKEANIDYTQARQNATGASNIGANVNRSASSNFAQYQNREMARTANLADSLANIDMQENNARSSLNINRANYEQGKSRDIANRKYQNRIDNLQNEATADFADQKLFSELSQVGSEFNKAENFKRQLANNKEMQKFYVNEALALINARNDNFQLDPQFVEKLKSGNYTIDDVIKITNITGVK